MPYRYLEHKADLFIESDGKNFPEALVEAAQGMFDAIVEESGTDFFEFEIQSSSLEDLVVDVLSELLSQSEILEIPFSRLEVLSFKRDPYVIKGKAYGRKDALTIGSVKAVTYHELSVKEKEGKVTIRVLLDI